MEAVQGNSSIVSLAQGEKFDILGHEVTVKMRSREANGNYVFELISPPGTGIPPHVHKNEDEVIYILEGEFEVMIDGHLYKATSGDYLNFTRNIPHGYKNTGTTAAKTLWHVNPGQGFEDFFDKLKLFPPGPPDMEKLIHLHEEYSIKLLL